MGRARPARSDAASLFEQAVGLASGGFLFDAIAKFKEVADSSRKDDLADDALYNAGLCYYQMNLFSDAVAYFSRVIQGYPDAKIHTVPGVQEHGRTAAKAYLGRLRSYLALGRREDAKKDLQALKAYSDSYVVDGTGRKRAYHELAAEALK